MVHPKPQVGLGETFEAVVDEGVYYGELTVGAKKYREPLPEAITQLPQEKQVYWMRRTIDKLRSRAKKEKKMALEKFKREKRAGRAVMQEQALHDQLTAMGIDRADEKPEGNEAQNG